MRTIGTELTRLDLHMPKLVGVVIDPASLREILTLGLTEDFSLRGVTLTPSDGLVFASHCLRAKAFPFVGDDGQIKMIVRDGGRPLHRRLSELATADLPELSRAMEARLRRLDATETLQRAVDEEAAALLALAA